MRPLRIVFSCLLLSAATVQTASAQDFWSFKDWNVSVELVPSEEDDYQQCIIFTGGDGLPVVSAEFFSGDAGPPYSYPEVQVEERAIRGYATVMANGDPISFTFDDGSVIRGAAESIFDEDGFAVATGRVGQQDNLLALQTMRSNAEVTVSGPGYEVITASLSGFSAAYLKMAEVCGFSTEGVLD
jgi:hypothetical protein